MGCSASSPAQPSPSSSPLAKPVRASKIGANGSLLQEAVQDKAALAEVSMLQLGVEVPVIPGDVALCGTLPRAAVQALAGRFKSWVNANSPEDPHFFFGDLEAAGVQHVESRPFYGPPVMPSDAQVAAACEALDSLPRPLMLQCTSGTRAGAMLLLWLVKKRGYSALSARQLAEDQNLKFWLNCSQCGPMREWLMDTLDGEARRTPVAKPSSGLVFAQLFHPDSWAFTYLLGCEETKEAVLIDPVLEQFDRDVTLLQELGLTLRFVLSTHVHADHVGSGRMIQAEMPGVRTVISRASGAKADILVGPGDRVNFGRYSLETIPTPGHTKGCVSWYLPGSRAMVFTGDALLIRGCGRTDLQDGDAGALYDSVRSKLFALPESTAVYPCHDYVGRNASTVEEEKHFNPRFKESRKDFVAFMSKRNLPHPDRLEDAVQDNMEGGAAPGAQVRPMSIWDRPRQCIVASV